LLAHHMEIRGLESSTWRIYSESDRSGQEADTAGGSPRRMGLEQELRPRGGET
jgi:hypothetical protein